jgi:hypothetical protein
MATMFESLEVIRETTNAARRTLGAKLEEFPTLADFAGYDAAEIYTALSNAFTDDNVVVVPPGTSVTLSTNYTLPADNTLWIQPGATFVIDTGNTLTLAGTIYNQGTLTVTGTLTPSGAGKVVRGSLITYGTGSIPAALTEAAGAIGGTNDGDIPDLSSPDDTKLTAAVRELAAKFNALRTALLG